MKVGIVGCSINGAYLAWKLSKKHDVTVFEKNKVIGEKPCSGLISDRLWNFVPRNDKLIENVIDEAQLHFPKKTTKLKFHPRMLVLDRKSLDQYVAELAKKAGANILAGTAVKKVYFVKGSKPQLQADELYEFDYLIGCDGFNSIVRRSLGIESPKHKLGIYTCVRKKSKKNFVDVYPTKEGFGWVIPRGSSIEYGFLDDTKVAKQNFTKLCKRKRVKPTKIYSHVIPEGLVRAEKGRVALCGDAIGLTKPTSSGGVIWGMYAADMLVKNFPDLKKYNSDVKRFFEPKFAFLRLGSRMSRVLGFRFDRLLFKELYFDSDFIL